MTIGRAMKEARLRAGLTQRMAAARIGCDVGTLCRYERERLEIPYDVLSAACQVYKSILPILAWFDSSIKQLWRLAA